MATINIKPISRRVVLQIPLISVGAAILSQSMPASAGTEVQTITVSKTPSCGCCHEWISHLQKNGFNVVANNVDDTISIRKRFEFPDQYGSCHTAKLGGYVIEGHVSVGDVRKLLQDKPQARGLAVPSMPLGSPGMEGAGRFAGTRHAYNVLLVLNDGSARIFKSYAAILVTKS